MYAIELLQTAGNLLGWGAADAGVAYSGGEMIRDGQPSSQGNWWFIEGIFVVPEPSSASLCIIGVMIFLLLRGALYRRKPARVDGWRVSLFDVVGSGPRASEPHCYQRSSWPLFIIFQRRDFHQGAFGVGAMHGLAVVPQSLLREPFRVAQRLCTFRPGVIYN